MKIVLNALKCKEKHKVYTKILFHCSNINTDTSDIMRLTNACACLVFITAFISPTCFSHHCDNLQGTL